MPGRGVFQQYAHDRVRSLFQSIERFNPRERSSGLIQGDQVEAGTVRRRALKVRLVPKDQRDCLFLKRNTLLLSQSVLGRRCTPH